MVENGGGMKGIGIVVTVVFVVVNGLVVFVHLKIIMVIEVW